MDATIVVLNYNYAAFVGAAIASALNQTHASCEVVVVDNGSTDHSLEVIGTFADRVRVVRQEVNVGQGQGYNLGFEAARGQWLLWLDADDLLDPDCIATCLAAARSDTAKVQFPLRRVDSHARPLGGEVPFVRHHGDVVPIIRRFGHYAGPPGSGNLYRRSLLAPYFPVPPQDWPICTDTVPFVVAPFHGRVVDTGRALGCYRLHQEAAAPGYHGNYRVTVDKAVRLAATSRERSLALLKSASGIEVAGPFLDLPTFVRLRIISWRAAPAAHPMTGDSAAVLWQLMRASLRECPGYTTVQRWLMLAWASGVLLLPAGLSAWVMNIDRDSAIWARLARWARSLEARAAAASPKEA